MTADEQLAQAIEEIKAEDEDKVFEALRMICEAFNWDISRRDPGPTELMLDRWAHLAEQPGAFLEAECGKQEIKESYRHLALVRRVP